MDIQSLKSHLTTLFFLASLQLTVSATDNPKKILPLFQQSRLPVRWQVGAYSTCSVACGGGVQNRTVICVKDDNDILLWDGNRAVRSVQVSKLLCPSPQPVTARSCNEHSCMAHWRKGKWSKCSVSCGVGVQERVIHCERQMLEGQLFAVSQSECGGLNTPMTSRQCYLKDCPDEDTQESSSILSEKYTLIQLRRAKKLKLNIGGKVKILPGQTVVVKCPVVHFSRALIFWSRGRKLVPYTGRIRTTNGGLKIFKANPRFDGGTYSCIAGDKVATINIQFTQKDDPSTKMYKDWARRSKRHLNEIPFQNVTTQDGQYNVVGGGSSTNGVLVTSSKFGRKFDGQQRDQSRRLDKTLNYVTGDWSACTTTCGSGGHRNRKVTCSRVTRKYIKIVPDTECSKQGLVKPKSVQVCIQNSECPVWRTGAWSQCSPSCGRVGYKTCILVCTWDQSGKPAGNQCDVNQKPVARKPCKPKPCPKVCIDRSRYCSLTRLLKLCRYHGFRQRCCKTCQYLYSNTTS